MTYISHSSDSVIICSVHFTLNKIFEMIYLKMKWACMSTLVLERNLIIGLDKKKIQRKIIDIFLPISFSICFGCSKELSH